MTCEFELRLEKAWEDSPSAFRHQGPGSGSSTLSNVVSKLARLVGNLAKLLENTEMELRLL